MKIPVICIIFLCLIGFISCNGSDSSNDDTGSTLNTDTDTTAPTLEEVTVITTPSNDSTPNYTFSSSEAGTINYGGSCTSGTTSVVSGNNIITLNSLSDGNYTDCTIKVTDSSSNSSVLLNISSFTIDTTAPTFTSVSPTDNESAVSITDNVSVTFSEAMDNSTITTNTSDSTCSGTLQLSLDNFSSCIMMSNHPISSNSNKTYTLDPKEDFLYSKNLKIKITKSVRDLAGNNLMNEYN